MRREVRRDRVNPELMSPWLAPFLPWVCPCLHLMCISSPRAGEQEPALSLSTWGREVTSRQCLCSPGGDSQPVPLGRRPPWAIPLALPVQQPRLVVEMTLNFSVTYSLHLQSRGHGGAHFSGEL